MKELINELLCSNQQAMPILVLRTEDTRGKLLRMKQFLFAQEMLKSY
jgi:hypothetical protein